LNKAADLERRLRAKQMQIDYLEKLIEIASKDSGIELKEHQSNTLEHFRMNKKSHSHKR
jgi:hypothetical protein